MSLSEIGLAGQQVDILNGGNAEPTGRLLSVAEIQHALRELRQRRVNPSANQRVGVATRVIVDPDFAPGLRPSPADTAPRRRNTAPDTARNAQGSATDPPPGDGPHTAEIPPSRPSGSLDSHWIAVLAAHAGAGASCVALALVDALSAEHRTARLVESAAPFRSGLVAAASAELGTDPSGAWRRGSRQLATLLRRTSDHPPDGWPEHGADDRSSTTVVDLGLPTVENLAALTGDQPRIVVCRVTVPGVRMTEQLLTRLQGAQVLVSAIGPRRWPGPVVASLGPQLRALRESGRVVAVPHDRYLQVSGPTTAPLPKPVVAAGRALLGLIDATHPSCSTPHLTSSALRLKGTDQCSRR